MLAVGAVFSLGLAAVLQQYAIQETAAAEQAMPASKHAHNTAAGKRTDSEWMF